MTSHNSLPYATPTCDSYERTDGRTNEESWLSRGDHLTSVTRAHTYDDSPFRDTISATLDALELATKRAGTPRLEERDPIHPWVRRAIYWRDANQCGWCFNTWSDDNPLVLDHIKPWSAGGSDASDNLRTLCRVCNDRRSNFATDSWVRVTPIGLCDTCYTRRNGELGDIEDDRPATPIFCGHCGIHRVASNRRRVL